MWVEELGWDRERQMEETRAVLRGGERSRWWLGLKQRIRGVGNDWWGVFPYSTQGWGDI